VVPALAVAAALRAEGAEVSFIGGERAEAQLVPGAGFPLHTISVEGLSRSNPLHALRALARALIAFLHAWRLLGKLDADAVMGGGGYVAGPVGLAALLRRIPLILTEADSHLGLTNRALAPFARRVCLSFPIAGRESSRYRLTGRPIPPPREDRAGARERLGIAPDGTCVLVFGGSLGARSINMAAIEGLTDSESAQHGEGDSVDRGVSDGGLPDSARRILHVCGRRDYPELSSRPLPQGYDLREYLDLEDFADALAAADLVVARSGGSVFEIAAHGVPAILVPYPHAAADHQSTNARWMADAGAAIAVADSDLSAAGLSSQVASLLADRTRLAQMARASRGLARPDAAAAVASELLEATRR
jgi:UDP-N-acetylglucosamine--N-acetylmuramyl-(pentapeptide) pyrophosphoryl-undecaprenol N-acetylglucosamine transferase